MKKIINRVQEERGSVYELYGTLEDAPHPEGYKSLIFSSAWTGAKNPEIEYTKLKLLLSPEALQNLRDLLEGK